MFLPLPTDRRGLRWTMLLCGLALFGISSGLIVQAGLGLDPWDVLHQGLARTVGLQVGTWAILVSVVVLLLWLPLRARFGVGTVANALLVGLWIDLTTWLVPMPQHLVVKIVMLVGGVLLNAVATGLYIGAGFGPGPRDGLTLAIADRGHPIRVIRTCIEASVLAVGWLLGGSVGVGTVLYAASIGPLTHVTIPFFALAHPVRPVDPEVADESSAVQPLRRPGGARDRRRARPAPGPPPGADRGACGRPERQ